jgi:hypothetical protein
VGVNRRRNRNARHPDVLSAQRRERARIRSEKRPPLGPRTFGTMASPGKCPKTTIADAA